MKEMYEKYCLAMLKAIKRMNRSAEEKDLLRNHTNYVASTVYASIIRDFGHKVDLCAYRDRDYFKSDKIIIDEKEV